MGQKKGAIPWNKGRTNVYSAETRKKMSEAKKGKPGISPSEETRKKIAESNRGLKRSEETRRRVSEAQIGKKRGPRSEEVKQKISESHKGKKLSVEHRKKLSESHKGKGIGEDNGFYGRKHTAETKEKIAAIHRGNSYNKGRKINEDHRKKLSEAKKGKCGPDSNNWQGGISFEPYCHIWGDKEYKESIKMRDNYKCQNDDCWRTAKRLSIHHIDYEKKNCHPENLITLCISCNSRANKNRDFWQKYYTEKIKMR